MTEVQHPLVRADESDLNQLYGRLLLPSVRAQLSAAGRGQRFRVTSLPKAVAEVVCQALQGDPRWVARVVVERSATSDWEATATKLIEFRNLLVEPMVVFIPPGLRVAAEDSLDLATFSELSLTDLEQAAREELLGAVQPELADRVRDALEYCLTERVIHNQDQVIRYLLTLQKNGGSAYAAGGALFELGLIPHFGLFDQPNTRFWLSRNKNAVVALADARSPLQERITRLRLDSGSVQTRLFAYCRSRTADPPTVWAAGIACDSVHRHLALDGWTFAEAAGAQNLRLVVDSIDLPMQPPDEVGGALALPVLNLNDARKGLKVVFRSLPPPAQVDAWATFRFQLLAPGDPPTAVWQSNSYPRPAGRQATIRRTLKADEFAAVEEGTYFLRVQAYDKAGTELVESRPIQAGDLTRGENESDLFLITRGEAEVEPPVPRTVRATSLMDAWARASARAIAAQAQLPDRAAICGSWAEPMGAAPRGDTHCRLSGGDLQGYEVVLPALIRRLEYTILNAPDHVGSYRLNFGRGKEPSDVQVERRPASSLPGIPAAGEFLKLRAALFAAILAQPTVRGCQEGATAGLIESVDLLPLTELVDNYLRAYSTLAAAVTATPDGSDMPAAGLAALAGCDTVEVRWRRIGGGVGRAALLSPTHPLRLAWAVRHAAHVGTLVSAWRDGREALDWGR